MDMKGYDRAEAVAFMLPKLDKSEFKALAAQAETLLAQAIDADFAYMFHAGILGEDGLMGNAYYDDDDAFEFILDRIVKARKASERDTDQLAAFIDQYMDLQEQYLESKGLMSWE